MKKLLIAYDGSDQADEALVDLSEAGLPSSLEVRVLCVADVWMPPEPPVTSEEALSSIKHSYQQAVNAVAHAQSLAENAATRLRGLFPGWVIDPRSCGDSPPWAVVAHAREWGADLIVVGAHSHSTLQRLFLGSVAGKVAAEAPCSVRIARPRLHAKHEGLRLMIAVDGSKDSVNAVRAVADRSWPDECQCRIVTVIDPKLQTAAAYPQASLDQWIIDHVKGIEDWANQMTEQLGQLLREKGLPTESQIHEGDPKKVLLRQAEKWNADCLFLGARGLQHGDRLYLGSLANAVATRAHCSVEIVRSR